MTPRKTSIGHETAAHWALFRRATGYAHVGTDDRSLDSQTDTFSGAEAEKIFADKLGGSKRERPEPNKMLGQFRGGDVAIVTKYNRLGRSLKDLLEIVETTRDHGAGFRSLAEDMNITTPAGSLMFHVFAFIPQFERERISERIREGLASTRKRGLIGGRPLAPTIAQKDEMRRMRDDGQRAVA